MSASAAVATLVTAMAGAAAADGGPERGVADLHAAVRRDEHEQVRGVAEDVLDGHRVGHGALRAG